MAVAGAVPHFIVSNLIDTVDKDLLDSLKRSLDTKNLKTGICNLFTQLVYIGRCLASAESLRKAPNPIIRRAGQTLSKDAMYNLLQHYPKKYIKAKSDKCYRSAVKHGNGDPKVLLIL